MSTQNKESLYELASQRLGISKEEIERAEKSHGKNILNNLSESDKQKVTQVLNDPEMTKKILSSQKAQDLLKKFFKEK